jgi:lipoprotein NlpD
MPTPTLPSLPPPIAGATESDWRPQTYTVKRGDTLHAIALDHGLDYRDLAAWNNLDNPNRIEVGQVLRLAPPGAASAATGVTTTPLKTAPPVVAQPSTTTAVPLAPAGSRTTDNYKAQPKLFKEPYSEQALRDAQRAAGVAATPSPTVAATTAPPTPGVVTPAPATSSPPTVAEATPATKGDAKPDQRASNPSGDDDGLRWMWPANGKVIAGYSETSNLKGIDIGGAAGTPIVASAPGKVVYAGSGLRGYGKLIIVKHNSTFLSAYAHNREILVKEGQQVVRGQKIAEMGNTDTSDVKLHFEIRRLGKPVDPLKYLPPV